MLTQTIVAMSGRKGAGKNTVASHIGNFYKSNRDDDCVFECSFADSLKQFCIEVLGLSKESCCGTEEQKNAPTQYCWEQASAFYAWKFGSCQIERKPDGRGPSSANWIADLSKVTESDQLRRLFHSCDKNDTPLGMRTGPMSGREVMQLFGTELIRENFGNVWAAATIRAIERKGKDLSIITDNRFKNEVDAVLSHPRGYIIRLTRSPYGYGDKHPSEASLDDFDWNREKCFVLDNQKMTIEEQQIAAEGIVREIFKNNV